MGSFLNEKFNHFNQKTSKTTKFRPAGHTFSNALYDYNNWRPDDPASNCWKSPPKSAISSVQQVSSFSQTQKHHRPRDNLSNWIFERLQIGPYFSQKTLKIRTKPEKIWNREYLGFELICPDSLCQNGRTVLPFLDVRWGQRNGWARNGKVFEFVFSDFFEFHGTSLGRILLN